MRLWARGGRHQEQEGRCTVNVEEILEEVEALPLDEQLKLKNLLDHLLVRPGSSSPEDEFERRLFAAGLLSELKPPPSCLAPEPPRKLIHVKGKPLSEIIVEERR